MIFGWDVADALYDNAKLTGWHTSCPDTHAVLDPSTARLSWEPGVVALLADFRDGAGEPHPALSALDAEAGVLAYAERLEF